MINKSLRNSISAIALFGLSGIAFAGPADSDTDSLFTQQRADLPTEYILSEMYTVVDYKTTSKNTGTEQPVENRTNRSASQGDNFEWVPSGWHSAY
ncbi:hypothetical protein [Kaarinaea lacus]